MARERNKLNAKQVATLAGREGMFSDGGGLFLRVGGGRCRWVYRFTFGGKRRDLGLGPYPPVTISDARKARDEAERLARSCVDPIAARHGAARDRARRKPFSEIAEGLIEAKRHGWRASKTEQKWRRLLSTHASALWSMPVDEIGVEDVLSVLRPLWAEKHETARDTRAVIESVLDAAKAQGLRQGENPAAWSGNLAHLLPRRQKLARPHHAALPYAEMPTFMERLREDHSSAALALELIILAAARSGEVRNARWIEFDMAARLWVIPPSRMKGGREHRVPLSDRAITVLERALELAKSAGDDLVFHGSAGGALHDTAIGSILRKIKPGVTTHGFRSTFRDWAGNETHFPREVAEQALAHAVGDSTEVAYRRGDALEKRRALMDAWAAWCEPKTGGNVVKFKRSAGNPAG